MMIIVDRIDAAVKREGGGTNAELGVAVAVVDSFNLLLKPRMFLFYPSVPE